MPILNRSRKLSKELTLFGVFTIATGATLSSGFFLLPGLAASVAGSGVVLAYMLAVLPLLPGILSKIELATAMPRAGGEYYFIDRALGPLAGTVGGLGTWCSLVLKTSFALIGIGAYLDLFFPEAPKQLFVLALSIALAIVLGYLNIRGARQAARLQTLLVLGLLGLLTWFVIIGLPETGPSPMRDAFDNGFEPIIAAAGMVCISYMGITKVASVAEEVKNPERNLTLGILLALGVTLVVYILGTYVIVGVLPHRPHTEGGLHGSLTPVADAANAIVGPAGQAVMIIAAVLAFLSVSNAGILSASRYPLAMSRDHLLPAWFRNLNERRSPRNAILVTVGAVIFSLVALNPIEIAKLASAFLLLLFALNCFAVIVMRESRIDSYDPGFRCPFYPWTQILGIILPAIVIVEMGWKPVLFTALLIAIGIAWYVRYARRRVVRDGAIYHLFARLGQRRFEGLDRELRSILKEKGLREDDPFDSVVADAAILDCDGPITYEQLVERAAERLAAHMPVTADKLVKGFLEGTRVGATPVSKGAALPHLRLDGIDIPCLVLARVPSGVHVEVHVDYVEHHSDQALAAIFFLVSPEDKASQHLRILAELARHIDEENFMIDWLAAENEQQLKEVVLREDRFLSLTVDPHHATGRLIGAQLQSLPLPEDSLIAMIHRAGQMIVPRGSTTLQAGDRVTIIGLPDSIQQLAHRFASTRH